MDILESELEISKVEINKTIGEPCVKTCLILVLLGFSYLLTQFIGCLFFVLIVCILEFL